MSDLSVLILTKSIRAQIAKQPLDDPEGGRVRVSSIGPGHMPVRPKLRHLFVSKSASSVVPLIDGLIGSTDLSRRQALYMGKLAPLMLEIDVDEGFLEP